MTDYTRWPEVAGRPAHRLLALADIGAREVHYDFARRFPEQYPGHTGGSLTCPHPDCQAVAESIAQAIDRDVA